MVAPLGGPPRWENFWRGSSFALAPSRSGAQNWGMAEQEKRGGGRLSRELLFGATAIPAYLAAAKVLVYIC